jgi:hypothetical protein
MVGGADRRRLISVNEALRYMNTTAKNALKTLRTLPATAALLVALATQPFSARAALPGAAVDLSVLVITAETNDYSLASIREALDFIGTPYHVHVATENPGSLTSDTLRSGTRGFYQGVIMSSASLAYTPDGGTTWMSALTPAEWAVLEQYEVDFGARRLNWYGYPGPDQGFNWPNGSLDTSGNPINAQWTTEGSANFVYLNTQNTYPIENVWTYLATPLDADTKVWLTDGNGNALLASKSVANGREILTKTFDSATWQMNSSVLYHGLINWVTKGLFLGDRHTYVSAQIDDVFLADDIFTGGEYRQDANDWQAVIDWQNNFRQRPSGVNFRYDMAFNGVGTDGQYNPDTLTPIAQATEAEFKWISHTWSHPYLTAFSYAQAMPEIVKNNQKAVELGLSSYSVKNMVTPNITGLENPGFLNAAYDAGIRYLVTDTSIDFHRAPSPNAGIPNWYVPGILMIPRHANNLFYNVSTPAQWEAEYNFLYSSFWGRNLTYAEILEDQSDLLLRPLLKGDVSPQMFHQPNLRDFNGQGNTLLGDLLDRVADKYEYYYNFPFLSPTQDKLGETVQARMDYNASGVVATRNGDGSLTLTVSSAATIPVTGLKTPGAEFYAGQWITRLDLTAGQVVTLFPDGNGGFTLPNAPGNFAPVASDLAVATAENTALAITLTATDADNDSLTFAIAAAPANGSLSGAAPNLTYTPAANWNGTDAFQFSVTDGQLSAVATVTVNVTPRANTAPIPGAAVFTTAAGTPLAITLSATDADSDPLAFALASSPTLGTLSGTAPDLTYTPNPNQSGVDTFQFTVSDGRATSLGMATITIEAPVATSSVVIDGNFADWADVASVGAGLNLANTAGNELDLTALKVSHSDTHLNFLYENENAVTLSWGYTLYFDTDRDPQTGFAMWDIGADYMLQGATLYRYTGTGSDWSWAFVESAASAVNGNAAELAVTRAGLGNPTSVNYLFYGENAAFGGPDYELVPASNGHLRYDLVAPTAGGIQIDGNLSDWTGPALATDGDDVSGANNPLDLRELRFANDADHFYFAYVNEGPLALNWGATLYLDTDANPTSGFGYWSTGADYMVQGANVYRYTGTGADWSWAWVGGVDYVTNGGTLEASFPKSFLGAATTINLVFHGENSAFGGTTVDTVPNDLGTPLTYNVQ